MPALKEKSLSIDRLSKVQTRLVIGVWNDHTRWLWTYFYCL